MKRPLLLLAIQLFAATAQAAAIDKLGLNDPDADIARNLTTQAVGEDVPATDARVARTRDWIAGTMRATGEDEKAVAAASMRLSRYLFEVAQLRSSPLEVLEALARHTPASKSLNATMNRYFELRVKQKLDHAGALAALK